MVQRGKLLIVGFLALALAAPVFSIWYLRGLTRKTLDYLGPETAELIARAPVVEALRLGGAENAPESMAELEARVQQRHDISQARGLINVRRGLVSDSSFDWSGQAQQAGQQWEYALEFRDGERKATLAFSNSQALLVGRDRPLSTQPIAAGIRAFFAEQFDASR